MCDFLLEVLQNTISIIILVIVGLMMYKYQKRVDKKCLLKSSYSRFIHYYKINFTNVYCLDKDNAFSGIIDIRKEIKKFYLDIIDYSNESGDLYNKTIKLENRWKKYHFDYVKMVTEGSEKLKLSIPELNNYIIEKMFSGITPELNKLSEEKNKFLDDFKK